MGLHRQAGSARPHVVLPAVREGAGTEGVGTEGGRTKESLAGAAAPMGQAHPVWVVTEADAAEVGDSPGVAETLSDAA